ncbi:hypothetical protein EYR41_011186 [Orbilia oligospora]|uniref:Uncharacterized protein n=1 Tax=Orbilia oligospora TaxID=2813651 RepID=A0A7C8K952_ORBOL|nr:hypothetical protein TWF751_007945 [Orbilia oligospora]KAF3253304.1 hypothetical protein TWF217_007560 [Orbilia oligospora]KAF3255117.1 hypothetical protein TWF128_005925 [Orbilia oligospora]KAF3298288.1 hypothetical protein TWF132_000117 [Orbilia oligospora]TGJ63253.1 hypothetical protein EYR41_011186 [Orbilia oligospora]
MEFMSRTDTMRSNWFQCTPINPQDLSKKKLVNIKYSGLKHFIRIRVACLSSDLSISFSSTTRCIRDARQGCELGYRSTILLEILDLIGGFQSIFQIAFCHMVKISYREPVNILKEKSTSPLFLPSLFLVPLHPSSSH